MMKKTIVTAVMLSAIVTCSVPMTSYAADVTALKQGKGYVVLGGQGIECLQQTLKDICESLGNYTDTCPEKPVTPEQPDVQEPSMPEKPDVQEPGMSEKPDVQEPGMLEQPDVQEPGMSEQPDVQNPDVSTQPDNQNPDMELEDEGIHFYTKQILNLVNEERAKEGLSDLKLDARATAAANVRAKEIKQQFSHTRPNGQSFSSALIEQGVTFRRSGENIAWGQKTPKQVMNAWMNSEGHRANIMSKNFENIGIGYYRDENGRNYWVQLFTA